MLAILLSSVCLSISLLTSSAVVPSPTYIPSNDPDLLFASCCCPCCPPPAPGIAGRGCCPPPPRGLSPGPAIPVSLTAWSSCSKILPIAPRGLLTIRSTESVERRRKPRAVEGKERPGCCRREGESTSVPSGEVRGRSGGGAPEGEVVLVERGGGRGRGVSPPRPRSGERLGLGERFVERPGFGEVDGEGN